MRQRHLVFLILWTVAAGWAHAAEKPPAFDAAPASARGTFVQRKVLKDLDVTLTSSGTFRFEKGAFFEWTTVRPVRSVFTATPTNWSFAASGRTAVHPLAVDVSSFEKIFEIKEVKEFVRDVRVRGEGFPARVDVAFRNGDRLEIDLTRDGGAARK